MKASFLVTSCVLAMVVSGWSVKRSMEKVSNEGFVPPSPAASKNEIHAPHVNPPPAANVAPGTLATKAATSPQSPSPVIQPMATPAVWTSSASGRQPESSGEYQSSRATNPASPRSPRTATPTRSQTPGFNATIATSSTVASNVASTGGTVAGSASPAGTTPVASAAASVLELDPGIPVPAALLEPDAENLSPTVAAAQQQIADSFVQQVENALSQPESPAGDAAVNETYYDSVTQANELYRALYGDQAYNNKTMQATMEAKTGQ